MQGLSLMIPIAHLKHQNRMFKTPKVVVKARVVAPRVDQRDPWPLDTQTQTAAQGAGIQDPGTTEDAAVEDDETTVAASEKTTNNSSGENIDENGLTGAERRQVETT